MSIPAASRSALPFTFTRSSATRRCSRSWAPPMKMRSCSFAFSFSPRSSSATWSAIPLSRQRRSRPPPPAAAPPPPPPPPRPRRVLLHPRQRVQPGVLQPQRHVPGARPRHGEVPHLPGQQVEVHVPYPGDVPPVSDAIVVEHRHVLLRPVGGDRAQHP